MSETLTVNERWMNGERTEEGAATGITDKLRLWAARELASWKMARERYDEIIAIADRIDAEYAAYRAAVDGMLKEYVKLPVDADGVPIHVGDVMEWPDGSTFDVVGISANTLFYVEHDFDNSAHWTVANNKFHAQPDSWESIITDALKFAGNGGIPVGAKFADYAEEFVDRCRRFAE